MSNTPQITDEEREILRAHYSSRIRYWYHCLAAKWYYFRRDRDKWLDHCAERMMGQIFKPGKRRTLADKEKP